MRRFSRRRSGPRGGKKRQVRWAGAWWYGLGINLAPANDGTGGSVANFWVRWPTGLPDPDNDELRLEEDTWIKVFNNFAGSTSTGGANSALGVEIAFGLIAWDAMDPIDFGVTTGVFPNPCDQNFDWIWRWTNVQTVSNNIVESGPSNADLVIAARSMRKQPPGTGVVALVGQQNGSAIELLTTWTWDIRYAVKTQ